MSIDEAAQRLQAIGPNRLDEAQGPHWVRRLARNFTHLFAVLLWTGAALAWVSGAREVSVAVVAVIFVNAIFSFAQEFRAERSMAALQRMLPQRVRVRRAGLATEIDAEDLVPGDVMLLSAGDRVSADAGLLSDVELRVDMSALTGESDSVHRHVGPVADGTAPLEAPNLLFAGTYVVAGAGEALASATGMRTELGRIAQMSRSGRRRPSPLENEMTHVSRLVAAFSVSMGATFFVVAGVLGMSLEERFLFAIGVIVANVPEGLLPTITLSLAMATQRMARRNALVRRLSSVETLGATTVICTDKTGTLTANEMTVRRVWMPGAEVAVEGVGYAPAGSLRSVRGTIEPDRLHELARAGALCNDADLRQRGDTWEMLGDPTEGALLTFATKAGLDLAAERDHFPRRHEIPFDSVRKRMTTVHEHDGSSVAYIKGAPVAILERGRLGPAEREALLAAVDAMARESLRVLAIARRVGCPPQGATADLERDLEVLGLVGMEDPPRREVADAIDRCQTAGIQVLMVTGDDGVTAEAIARRIGLVQGRAHIVDGGEVESLDSRALASVLLGRDVLVARVTPEQKLRIAEALRAHGEIVAMTGDGVNDAPALRSAHIGVAMGRGGTDVAREAADIVLLDDNFASIAAAVEEGRAVYDNIRRFTRYHFSSNVAELLAFLVWGLSGGAIPLPLVVMQVLAIDLGTDLLPAIALGTERAEPGTMSRPPRPASERLLNARVLAPVYGFVGLIVGVAGLISFFTAYAVAGWRPGEPLAVAGDLYVQATAMTCAGIVAGQIGAALAFRTDRQSVLKVGLLSNRLLTVAIVFEVGLLIAMLYAPPLQKVFHTQAPPPVAWALLLLWPVVVFAAEELRKAIVRRRLLATPSATDVATTRGD